MAGQARVCVPRKAGQEGVRLYAAAGNPRRTPSRAKRAIYGWTIVRTFSINKGLDYLNFNTFALNLLKYVIL
jgi:hypothetical protein